MVAVAVGVLLVVFSGAALAEDDEDDEGGSKPAVVLLPAVAVHSASAVLRGEVNPQDRTTSYRFEYGTTTAYGAETASASAGGADSWRSVTSRIDGLVPETTYHYRLVATNAAGTARSADYTFTTLAAPAGDVSPAPEQPPDDAPADAEPLEPQLGTTVAVAPGRGEVRVRPPGESSFVPLPSGSELPVGSEVDVREGQVALTAALPSGETQTGRFGGGRFVFRQGKRGLVHLHLRGAYCPRPSVARRSANEPAVAVTTRKRRSGRRLWGRDRGGRFRTHGKNSHATVRGTRWVVADGCDGTMTRVAEGSVVVYDKIRRKRVIVRVGERHLAPPRR